MTRYYVIVADNVDNHIYDLTLCQDCVWLQRQHTIEGSRIVCKNPKGLARPALEGFCNYAVERAKVEARYE